MGDIVKTLFPNIEESGFRLSLFDRSATNEEASFLHSSLSTDGLTILKSRVETVLADGFKTAKTILEVVGDFYNIDLLDTTKYSCRKRKYVYPRMVASYIIIDNKILNFRQTGLLYKCKEKPKGLNHASIINYINTVSCFLETDSIFKYRFLLIFCIFNHIISSILYIFFYKSI